MRLLREWWAAAIPHVRTAVRYGAANSYADGMNVSWQDDIDEVHDMGHALHA
jgi:hypothetical protein